MKTTPILFQPDEQQTVGTPIDDEFTEDQREVLRRLEEYPARVFYMLNWYSAVSAYGRLHTIFYASEACFTCVAGWSAKYSYEKADNICAAQEAVRLADIAGSMSSAAHKAMQKFLRESPTELPKSEAISRVREIFRMRGQ